MKHKHQDSIIRLAFGEHDSETEKRLLEAGVGDADSQKEFELVSLIREGLKKAGHDTPQCQMSIERVRDAILNQNIRETRNSATFWSWASVGVAACAFLYVLSNNRSSLPETRLVSNTEKTNFLQETPTMSDKQPDTQVVSAWQPSVLSGANVSAHKPKETTRKVADRPSLPAKWNDITSSIVKRTAETVARVATRSDATRNAHAVPFALSDASASIQNELFDSAVTGEQGEPIILINTDTDTDTGAQVATEVQSFENIPIGG